MSTRVLKAFACQNSTFARVKREKESYGELLVPNDGETKQVNCEDEYWPGSLSVRTDLSYKGCTRPALSRTAFTVTSNTHPTFTFKECVFKDCSYADNGGALYFTASSNTYYYTLIIDACNFTNCQATSGGGGAVYALYLSVAKVTNSNFTNCNATSNAGSLYLHRYTATAPALELTIDGCSFSDSKASSYGGAVCAGYITTADIKNSKTSGSSTC